ncbi:MAG: hypothetical protein ACKN9T_07725, partial [Candidatus Methylumidiphilus sp.]
VVWQIQTVGLGVKATALTPFCYQGNLKEFFLTQEVPPGQAFHGAVCGIQQVRLNAATAALFGRKLPVVRYCLHSLQLTGLLALDEAAAEINFWSLPK